MGPVKTNRSTLTGFVVGEPQSEEAQNRIITKETGSVTVSVDYRKLDSPS